MGTLASMPRAGHLPAVLIPRCFYRVSGTCPMPGRGRHGLPVRCWRPPSGAVPRFVHGTSLSG